MKLKKHFCSLQQSLKLQKLGFDEECLGYYKIQENDPFLVLVDDPNEYDLTGFRTCRNSNIIISHYISAPLRSQVFEFFREYHNIYSTIDITDEYNPWYYSIWNSIIAKEECNTGFDAEDAYIDKLIEIMINVNKLFTTEDGVDVFYDDITYGVIYDKSIKDLSIKQFFWSNGNFDSSQSLMDDVKYFSTQKAAEKYIQLNRKQYSIQEIINYLNEQYEAYPKFIEEKGGTMNRPITWGHE